MNDQIVELSSPGLQILLHSPFAAADLEEGGRYVPRLPDGRDLVDHINECRFAAIGVRWPEQDYWLHFSSTMDRGVIQRSSDHVLLGLEVSGGQLHVRAGDDLFEWCRKCKNDRVVTIEDGYYVVTACMLPLDGDGPIRIYLHFAAAPALPDLGYAAVPELYCEPPLF